MENTLAVDMKNITKEFSGVKAVDSVDFKVAKGEIHALVGENGAGKSTLMKMLSASYPYHSFTGSIWLNGKEVKMNRPIDARNEGVVMVHQELALINEVSVAENMFMGNLPMKFSAIDWNALYKKAEETLQLLNLDVNVRAKIKTFGVGQQQLVEISRAVMLEGKIMILDEPTAPLTDNEIVFLFKLLRDLKEKGMTIIYISHRLDEIFELADRVTIMRDGKIIDTKKISETNHHDVVSCMIGREMEDLYPKVQTTPAETALEIVNYSVPHPSYIHKNIVENANMMFRKGEIVGISGLLGSGRTELMSAITGTMAIKGKGTVKLNGNTIRLKTPKQAIANGIGYVTEDRKGNGLVLMGKIRTNITLGALDKIVSRGVINKKKEISIVNEMVKRLQIKIGSIENSVDSLSGGNQQKVVIAKWLATDPEILILDEPTRGVDVGARYEIYSIMKELAKQGVAIVMISSDLPEIIGMSDRVYVMHEGRVTGELNKDELDESTIMGYATGIAVKA